MTETAKAVIDRLQGEAGYATGGYVDRLVFSGLDVHEMLNEIEQAIDTDKLSVEKLEPIGYYNEAHGFLHDEFDKDCYCQGGCSMEAVYTESQVKKLTGENKVEKLQEQNKTMKLALVELSDENIYDNTGFFANEYAKNLVEQLDAGEIETIVERCNRNLQEIRVEELKDFNSKILQAELKNQKLQEQLNTAKYFFKNILDVNPNLNKGHVSHLENCVRVMKNSAKKALTAIGNEGSGDEC